MGQFEPWVGDCHLRKTESGDEFQCRAAVWSNKYETFRAHLAACLKLKGYSVLWIEEALPASQYLARHGDMHKIGFLARAVHPNHLVELSHIASIGKNEAISQTYLISNNIKNVKPLDAQLGIWPEKNIPDALLEPLFSQPKQTDIEAVYYTNEVPTMNTYAVLDTAKLQWGFNELKNCKMPYRCLFRGDAGVGVRQIAPYLIELDKEKQFTRLLFKHDPAMPNCMTSVHLWHQEPAIYIRTRASFEDLWKHLRRFTKTKDENGKNVFFRFYHPYTAIMYFEGHSDNIDILGSFLNSIMERK